MSLHPDGTIPRRPKVRSYLGGNNGNVTRTTSDTITFPTYAAGDKMILFLAAENSASITVPTGFTGIYNHAYGTGIQLRICEKIMDGTEGASISYVHGTAFVAWCAVVVRGSNRAAMEAGVEADATSTSGNPPSFSPSWGAKAALFFASINSVGTTVSGFPSGFTNLYNAGGSGGACVLSVDYVESGGPTVDPGAYTLAASKINTALCSATT